MESAKEFYRNELGKDGKMYLQITRKYEKCLANKIDNHIKKEIE